MIFRAVFLYLAPSTETIGAVVGIAFFLVFAGVAFVAYKILKRTAKMAVRTFIVALIMLIAVAGSVSLWWFSSGGDPKLKPPANRRR